MAHNNKNMELSTNPHTLQRELEDIRMKRQELQRLDERERVVREKLEQVSSSTSPITINTNAGISRQHCASLSISPGSSYELAGRRHQLNSAGAMRASVAMTPRSQSNMGVSALATRPDATMARSISARSHPMSRGISQTSDLSRTPHTTNSSALLPGANTGIPDRLYQDELASAQLLGGCSRLSTSRLPEVDEDPLRDCGQNPMEFIMSGEDDGTGYAPASFPGTYYPSHHANDFFQYPGSLLASVSSSTPSLVSVDSAAAADVAPITRGNSSVGESYVGSFQLARLDSTTLPMAGSTSQDPFGRDFPLHAGEKQSVTAEDAYLLSVGANLVGTPVHAYPDPDVIQSTEMHRSGSNESARSTASHQERRAREARERQVQNGRRTTIAPRPSISTDGDASGSPTHLSPMSALPKKDSRVAVSKTHYQRPKHPKVHCKQCNDHPDGFRGEHELRRHTSSKHCKTVVKWICRDPASVGITPGVHAVNPLDKCKACLAKKQYGAYYNAAAHLRRAHFRERPVRSRANRAGGGSGEGHERRAGKGGGNFPAMTELRPWMRKVQVRDEIIISEEADDSAMDTFADPEDIDLMTYGNGGGLDYSSLDANPSYPSMLPELDHSPAENNMMAAPLVNGSLSPFSSSVSSMSPLQQDLEDSFTSMSSGNSHTMSPTVPSYLDYSKMDEYNMPMVPV